MSNVIVRIILEKQEGSDAEIGHIGDIPYVDCVDWKDEYWGESFRNAVKARGKKRIVLLC